MTDLPMNILHQIDELQLRYIDALGQRNMESWLATFDSDGAYFCLTAENEDSGRQIAYILDDCHERLEDRVKYVTQVWAGTFQDYRSRHFVQRLTCKPVKENLYEVRSNFCLAFTRMDMGQTEFSVAGIYKDLIATHANGACFKSKRAVLDAAILPHYMVYPI